MIYKSYIIEQNIDPVFKNKMFLFYGENEGLKKEFKKKIRNYYPKLNILRLNQEDILKNHNLLTNEILNKSLFEERKIIFIEQVNDKILSIIEELIDIMENENIFIFSNTLDKKSKIRSYFEKTKNIGITACYPDNEITIRKIIEKNLRNYHGLTPEVVNIILQNTNLDRDKVNNEIEKIKSCFKDRKIDLDKILLILNISENEDFNKLRDEAINGNKDKTNRLLADTIFDKENNVYYLNSINQRINKLNEIESLKTSKQSSTESVISLLKPPIFWKDKPILTLQSRKWNKSKLKKVLAKTYEVEINIKSNPTVRKELLIKNLIIEICNVANGP